MKELYLIPKHIYDVLNSSDTSKNVNIALNILSKEKGNIENSTNEVGQWKTRIPPPPLQKPILLNEIKVPRKKTTKSKLHELLPLKIKTSTLPRARLLLKLFEKCNSIEWDINGDITSPINNYNIIDIIGELVEKKDNVEREELYIYNHLISIANIPSWLIKNEKVLESINNIYSDVKTVKKKGGGIKFNKKPSTNKWVCY